jgi:hypothetical protein
VSYSHESISESSIAGLSPGASLARRLDTATPVLSGGSSYTYRRRVGFGVSSANLPAKSRLAEHAAAAGEHDHQDDLSWIEHLPPADLPAFLDELSAAARRASEGGDPADIAQLLVEWRATAEVHADPELYEALASESTDDFGPVPNPRA